MASSTITAVASTVTTEIVSQVVQGMNAVLPILAILYGMFMLIALTLRFITGAVGEGEEIGSSDEYDWEAEALEADAEEWQIYGEDMKNW